MSLLTICTAAYNAELYIDDMLTTLIKSEYFDELEIILVNDGSKDKTSEIAHSYAEKYPSQIIVVDKENGGSGSARNVAFSIATGKYIKILDADDQVDTKNFDEFMSVLKTTDVDMILTPHYCYYSGKVETKQIVVFNSSLKNGLYNLDAITLEEPISLAMHGVTYRTSIIQNNTIRLSEGMSYVDIEYISIPLRYVHTMMYLDIPVYMYQLGLEGQSVDPKVAINKQSNKLSIINRLGTTIGEFKTLKVSPNIIKILENNLYKISMDAMYIYLSAPTSKYRKDVIKLDDIIYGISKDVYIRMNKVGYISIMRKMNYLGYYAVYYARKIRQNIRGGK